MVGDGQQSRHSPQHSPAIFIISSEFRRNLLPFSGLIQPRRLCNREGCGGAVCCSGVIDHGPRTALWLQTKAVTGMMFDLSPHVPPRSLWHSAVAGRAPSDIDELWQPGFPVGQGARIVTAGSEFARHLGAVLPGQGYDWLNAERAPGSATLQKAYHYGDYSFRTGPILTARMLRQWLAWSRARATCPDLLWQVAGRWYDPFRPEVEFEGFESREEALASRRVTLSAVRNAIRRADVVVITLSQTEGWRLADGDIELAGPPPAHVGDAVVAVSARQAEVAADLHHVVTLIRRINGAARVILTLSAQPLAVSVTGGHVLAENGRGKAILRAAMAHLAAQSEVVEYFPAFELLGLSGVTAGAPDMTAALRLFFDGLARAPLVTAETDGEQPGAAGDL